MSYAPVGRSMGGSWPDEFGDEGGLLLSLVGVDQISHLGI